VNSNGLEHGIVGKVKHALGKGDKHSKESGVEQEVGGPATTGTEGFGLQGAGTKQGAMGDGMGYAGGMGTGENQGAMGEGLGYQGGMGTGENQGAMGEGMGGVHSKMAGGADQGSMGEGMGSQGGMGGNGY
jgi:hypothetical protein